MPLLALSIAGVSFCFFVGFPFGNHQESYMWLPQLEKMSLSECFTRQVQPVANYRPLGIATAWISYHLSSGIYLQQILNWMFAAVSFVILFLHSRQRALLASVAFIAGAGFFSGYIYLFHLHGVFYGPLQVYLAILTVMASKGTSVSTKQMFLLFGGTVVVSFFHPFALMLFLAFIAGSFFDFRSFKRSDKFLFLFLGALTVGLWYFLVPSLPFEKDLAVKGWLLSYTLTEVNTLLSLVSFIFAEFVVWHTSAKSRTFSLTAVFIVSIFFIMAHLPLLFIWIAACGWKMAVLRQWRMFSILIAASAFPFATATGSPTYVLFVIMVGIFCTCMNVSIKIPARKMKTACWILFIPLAIVLFLSLVNYRIPVLSRFISPILAEKEKTFQLEKIISRYQDSTAVRTYRLQLVDSANYPVHSRNNIARSHRPPTNQFFLDQYLHQTPVAAAGKIFLITFGDQTVEGGKIVWKEKGMWNGSACVFRISGVQ